MNFEDKEYTILHKIKSPADVQALSDAELPDLAADVRKELIDTVSATGGHLGPNLGVVELTIALHRTFTTPKDKFIWDVGHQCYVHKLFTDRQQLFQTLRQFDGCHAFSSREESEHDCFGAGHAGTAISAALGIAAARDLKGTDENVIAVVGDGSLNCGISLEGLNNVTEVTKNMIIILNDNKMSISKNVGAMHKYLNNIISGRGYNRFKAFAKTMIKKMPHGDEIHKTISKIEGTTKGFFVPGILFEQLGIRYLGPIDGHDLPTLIKTLEAVKNFNRPVIIHVITEKGRGYAPAAEAPVKFHGLSSFNKETGLSSSKSSLTFSKAFGDTLCQLAEKHPNVVGITAAMASGTGMEGYSEKFPKRFFDVGIAEGHGTVFAAGLAANGARPIIALYATFLQRAFDNLFHDICLQNLPVMFCIDRAGIVEDGPTHHGIQDLGFVRSLPNLSILMPKHENELRDMIFSSYEQKTATIIRYPRGGSGNIQELSTAEPESIEWGKAEIITEGKQLAIWALGKETYTAIQVAELLKEKIGITATIVNTRFLMPFDERLLKEHAREMKIVTIEDHQTKGGLATTIDETLINEKHNGVMHFGWGSDIVPQGSQDKLKKLKGISVAQIVDTISLQLKQEHPCTNSAPQ